jgi:hypothetical protein
MRRTTNPHKPDCVMRICLTVTTCPVCGAKIRPLRRQAVRDEQTIDEALHARPEHGFDVDGNRLGDPDW